MRDLLSLKSKRWPLANFVSRVHNRTAPALAYDVFVHEKQPPSAHAIGNPPVKIAAGVAMSLTLAVSGSLIFPLLVSKAVAQTHLQRAQVGGLPETLLSGYLRQDVKHGRLQREGNDAVAIGLIGSTRLGDWPYYGDGDYYGKGDYFTAQTPSLWCRDELWRLQD